MDVMTRDHGSLPRKRYDHCAKIADVDPRCPTSRCCIEHCACHGRSSRGACVQRLGRRRVRGSFPRVDRESPGGVRAELASPVETAAIAFARSRGHERAVAMDERSYPIPHRPAAVTAARGASVAAARSEAWSRSTSVGQQSSVPEVMTVAVPAARPRRAASRMESPRARA